MTRKIPVTDFECKTLRMVNKANTIVLPVKKVGFLAQ